MNILNINKEMNTLIRKGSLLPTIAISRILNGKHMIDEQKKMDFKSKVYLFIEEEGKVKVSDLMRKFNLTSEGTIKLLDEMESEGKIKQI